MDMYCPSCRLQQPVTHRFCVKCGGDLPGHLLDEERPSKAVRFFAGIKVHERDPDPGFLRISCYLQEQRFETPEGAVTIPGHHVRFSVWEGDSARCVMSLPETEAREAATFILGELARLNGETASMPASEGN